MLLLNILLYCHSLTMTNYSLLFFLGFKELTTLKTQKRINKN